MVSKDCCIPSFNFTFKHISGSLPISHSASADSREPDRRTGASQNAEAVHTGRSVRGHPG